MTLNLHLTQLEISGLIQLAQEYPELEYLFRHALMQDAAYGSLLMSDRKKMHSKVAQVLENLFAGKLDEVAAVLAHHWELAERPQKALYYFVQAGDAAAKVYANDEAVEHYGRSLTLAQQTPIDSGTLVHLCTALGRVLEIQSLYHEALAHYQTMSQLAEQLDDKALTLAALMGRTTLHVTATPVHDLNWGESLAQQAIALAQELGDEPIQTKLLWNMINFYQFSNRLDQAIATGERALVLVQKQPAMETEAYIRNDLAMCYNRLGRLQDSLHMAEQAGVLWRQLDNLPMLIDSLAQASIAHYYRGDYAQSIAVSDEGFQLGQAIGNPQAQAYVRVTAGLAYWKTGVIRDVLAGYRGTIQFAKQANFVPVLVYAHANLAFVLIGIGAFSEALMEAQTAQTLAQNQFPHALPYANTILALVQLNQGDLATVETTIGQIKVDPIYIPSPGFQPLVELAEAMWLADNGRYAQALAVIQTNQKSTHNREFIGFHPDYLLLKGQILSAMNQQEAAYTALQEAHALAQTHNNRQLLWQILAEEAALLKSLNKLEMAQSLYEEARQILSNIIADIPDNYRDSFRKLAAVTAVLQTS
ncbi:MAG: hypothetical protein HC804_08270 [Anaerolineae bacterium]|nr:hypothetical protein [Anaerolineae bacterium]